MYKYLLEKYGPIRIGLRSKSETACALFQNFSDLKFLAQALLKPLELKGCTVSHQMHFAQYVKTVAVV